MRALVSLGSQDDEHLVPFHARSRFHFAHVDQVFLQFFEDARAQLAMGHFAAAKPDRSFHLIAFCQPLAGMLHAIAVVVIVGARAELNFFDRDDNLFLLRLVRLLLLFLLKLSEVNDFANGRIGIWRHFNQIHSFVTRGANRLARIHHPKLFPVIANHAHLGHADPFVNSSYRRSPKIRTTATAKTCSYCSTSLVSGTDFSLCPWGESQTKVCATYSFFSARV